MKNRPETQLSKRIQRAFHRSGMSIKQLTERSGCTYSSVHGFITADRDITVSTASKLCQVLGLELRQVRYKRNRA
jgi:plasmid maintenance system antidote protein VapI